MWKDGMRHTIAVNATYTAYAVKGGPPSAPLLPICRTVSCRLVTHLLIFSLMSFGFASASQERRRYPGD